jgi:hypothetical protein
MNVPIENENLETNGPQKTGIDWDSLINILGFILAIFAFIVSVYFYFVGPSITYTIISNINVFDINKNINDLTIKYKNFDIINKKLLYIVIKVENDGLKDISERDYGYRSWGLDFANCQIKSLRLLDGSSDYIKKELNPCIENNTNRTESKMTFNSILFDRGEFAYLELLLITDKSSSFEINPFGKLSGMRKFNIRILNYKKNLFQKLFEGTTWINFLRFLIFGLLFIIVLISAAIGAFSISDMLLKRKKRRFIKQLKFVFSSEMNRELITDYFMKNPVGELREAYHSFIDEYKTERVKIKSSLYHSRSDTRDIDVENYLYFAVSLKNEEPDPNDPRPKKLLNDM